MSDSDLEAELTAADSKGEDPPEPKEPPEGTPEVEGELEPKDKGDDPEPTVPVSVLTAEREEGRKRADYWEGIARSNTQPPSEQPSADPVDFLAEPDKIAGFIDQKVKQATEGLSKSYAMRQHGKQVVDEAHAALKQHGSQAEQQALAASADPWGEVVEWHKRREIMAEIGDDPVAWRKAETERIKKELLAQAAVRQAKGLDPAPTLADEPNLGAREKTDVEPEDKDSLKSLIGE